MPSSRRHAARVTSAAALCLCSALLAPLAVHAQAWPDKPVKIFVGAAAGSAPDIIARLIGDQLGQMWGKGTVVENRPGAGGNLGAQAAARSAPDGHTLWFAHATPVVMNQFLFKNPGFDSEKDFDPVVRVGVNPMVISVNPGVPVKNLKELVAYVKARPGKGSSADWCTKNIPHLVGETLNQVAHIDMLNIPYKGSQQAAVDAIAGRTELYIDAVPPMAPFIGTDGKLRPIAVTTAQRLPGHEDIPTAREQGVELVMQGWLAFLAPAGTPADIVERVARDVNTVLAKPDNVARLRALGTFELGGTTAAFDRFVKEERAKWSHVVQAAKIERE
jgi:tripartite-type tricarboxylate transporter receptor subunit TctC